EYGNVLNLGRRTRTVSPALKKALDIRDETCRFPGCCANKYVEFHHVKHWGDFGPTNPDNLVKLCRFHHDKLHQGHFTVHLQQQTKQNYGQKWLFKTAAGEVIEPNPILPMSKTNDFFEEEWPNIDSQTAVSRWRGKPLNYPRVIKDLLRCKKSNKGRGRNKKP
ncbi:MAG: HNH endonuclease, partial [Algicola sp.]|nr:HNH endonuclease [Algicola sp.]